MAGPISWRRNAAVSLSVGCMSSDDVGLPSERGGGDLERGMLHTRAALPLPPLPLSFPFQTFASCIHANGWPACRQHFSGRTDRQSGRPAYLWICTAKIITFDNNLSFIESAVPMPLLVRVFPGARHVPLCLISSIFEPTSVQRFICNTPSLVYKGQPIRDTFWL